MHSMLVRTGMALRKTSPLIASGRITTFEYKLTFDACATGKLALCSCILRASCQVAVLGCFGSCLEPSLAVKSVRCFQGTVTWHPQKETEQEAELRTLKTLLRRNGWRLVALLDIDYYTPDELTAMDAETQPPDGMEED